MSARARTHARRPLAARLVLLAILSMPLSVPHAGADTGFDPAAADTTDGQGWFGAPGTVLDADPPLCPDGQGWFVVCP